jgi:hypothetical protein
MIEDIMEGKWELATPGRVWCIVFRVTAVTTLKKFYCKIVDTLHGSATWIFDFDLDSAMKKAFLGGKLKRLATQDEPHWKCQSQFEGFASRHITL